MSLLQRLRGFLAARVAWVRRYPFAWVSVGFALLTVGVIFWWPGPVVGGSPTDTRLRAWALLLQFVGGVLALADLAGAAREAGHVGVWGSIKAFFVEAVRGRNVVLHVASGVLRASGGVMAVKVRSAPGPDADVVARLCAIESDIKAIDAAVDELRASQQTAVRAVTEKIEALSDRLGQEVATIDARLRSRATGNFAQLAFGAFWVLVGTILSGLAPEIVGIAAGQWAAVWARF